MPEHCKIVLPTAPVQHVTTLGYSTNAWFDVTNSGRQKEFSIEEFHKNFNHDMANKSYQIV